MSVLGSYRGSFITLLVVRTMDSIAKFPLLPEVNARLFAFVFASVSATGSKEKDGEQHRLTTSVSLCHFVCYVLIVYTGGGALDLWALGPRWWLLLPLTHCVISGPLTCLGSVVCKLRALV